MAAVAKPGRPRSEQARRAVLAAASEMLERDGYSALTMESIARGAGVSKQTLYRWWPSKAAILFEALSEGAKSVAPVPDTGALATDVRRFLRATVAGVQRNGAILAALMSEAQFDPGLGETFRGAFLRGRRTVMTEILQRARDRGEFRAAVDLDLVAELAFAAIWYRLLARSGPLNRRFADQVTETVLRLVGVD